MNRIKNNESGFSAVEIVMVIVIVALIGAVGYLVYKNSQQAKVVTVTKTVTATPKTSTTASPTVDQTANWTSYKSTDGHYSLKYPNSWVTASNPSLCSSGILLVAPGINNVGKCGSEDFGQISFSGMTESSHLCYSLDSTAFSNITKSTVTISGVTLTKQSGTQIDDSAGNGSLPKGTIEVDYCYSSTSYGFMARYEQKPTDQNVLTDFNTIITKTLSFSN